MTHAIVKRLDNRRASFGLHRNHFWTFRSDPAQRFEFLERFPHSDDPSPAAGRIQNRIGQFPVKLLGEFHSHRLFAFRAIRFFERRDIEPAARLGMVTHDLARVVDETFDEIDMRAVDKSFFLHHLRRVFGDENVGVDASPRAVCRERRAGVPRRWHPNRAHAQLLCLRHCRRQTTRLETPGWIQSFFLDEQLRRAELSSQVLCGQKRRVSFTQGDDVAFIAHRHDLEPAPHVAGAFARIVLGEMFARRVEIVTRIQHLAAVGASCVNFSGRINLAAVGTFKMA